jgi:hypothetical protein
MSVRRANAAASMATVELLSIIVLRASVKSPSENATPHLVLEVSPLMVHAGTFKREQIKAIFVRRANAAASTAVVELLSIIVELQKAVRLPLALAQVDLVSLWSFGWAFFARGCTSSAWKYFLYIAGVV